METLSVPLFGSAKGALGLQPLPFPTNLLLVSVDLGATGTELSLQLGLEPEHGLSLYGGLREALVELGVDPGLTPAEHRRLARPLRAIGS